ncbi:hypothetical protein [Myxococcus phage Mx4 ts27htf-1hrm-1]|nr:hypothetical protein Mx4_p76 [Myxococcus phage Mx4]WNM70415.1 hypothetical protein [Myxococcus phage Mx4 ts27htf-1hrm-1]
MAKTCPELEWKRDVRKGSLSLDVRRVQEWLTLHGLPVKCDGDFGPKTQEAVKAFQARARVPPDGIVDALTFGLLAAPLRAALDIPAALPPPAGATRLGQVVAALALQHAKQHPREVGGPNSGPWVRLYMDGNQGAAWAWCAGFATFVVRQAAQVLALTCPVTRTYSCDVLAQDAQRTGRFLAQPDSDSARAKVTPGCLFLRRKAPGDWDHTGVVVGREGDVLHTVEGNTNAEGSREGVEARQRTRHLRGLDFVLL